MIDPVQFGWEFDKVCNFFAVNPNRRDPMKEEYGKQGRRLSEREMISICDTAMMGRYMPTLGEWNEMCRSISFERIQRNRVAEDQAHMDKHKDDAVASLGCKGGDCRACSIRFCSTITTTCSAIVRDLYAQPKSEARQYMSQMTKLLAEKYKNIGFERRFK